MKLIVLKSSFLSLTTAILGLFVSATIAQTLPNIESDLYEREIGLEPRMVVWSRPEQEDLVISVIVRFDEPELARYGERLPQLCAQLWNASLPRNMVTEQIGISFLQERDSLLNHLIEEDGTDDIKNTNNFAIYSDHERLLEEKTVSVKRKLSIPSVWCHEKAQSLGTATIIRYRLTPNTLDAFLPYLREQFENPVWIDEWVLRQRINQGYPDFGFNTSYFVQSGNIGTMPVVDGRLDEYWQMLLQHASIGIAAVGAIDGNEAITLANLYWSTWHLASPQATTERGFSPFLQPSVNYKVKISLPVRNRDVMLAWVSGGMETDHQTALRMDCACFHSIEVPITALDTNLSADIRRKQWIGKLQLDLDQPETAADRLAIAMTCDGWQRWFAIDDRMSAFETTPEAEWARAWQKQATGMRK